MSHLNGESLNIKDKNIEKLVELFPEVNTDGKIDFGKLKQILGEYVDDSEERYRFVWNGKGEALRLSQTPSMGTLRPAKEESKNWDETDNLYIEGDNLEVLKLLQKSYFNKVKMIYIDPPYNTGGDFVYKDNFKDNIQNYKKITGQVDSEGNATTTNREYSGRYHTDWLNMMYPRLRLAKNLLTDDGVIFISIDDREVHNLRKICDEIFGEENLLNSISLKMSELSGVKMANVTKYPKLKEHLLIYGKMKNKARLLIERVLKEGENLDSYLKYYSNIIENIDEAPQYWSVVNISDYIKKNNINFENKEQIKKWKIKNSNRIIYRTNSRTVSKFVENNPDSPRFYKFKNNNGQYIYKWDDKELLFLKDYLEEYLGDIWLDISTINLNKENCGLNFFQNGQKPLKLIKRIIKSSEEKDSIILDFFAGSSTTAHAVMDLNAEDNGNRKFIMVQLPEPTDKKSEAYKAGYENIAEIGKERIRRAGEKIKAELKEKYDSASEEERKEMKHPDELDIGFKVFKLDSSNIKEWNPGKYENVQQAIEDALTPYVPGRTEEDVVYEMMLKMGLDLTYPVEEIDVNGKTIYSIGYGFLMICLADNIDITVAEKMIEIKDENNQQEFRAIFRDEGFSSDTDKTNVKETLRSAGLAEESFITL